MKKRELYGVKVLVPGEEFDDYKGTLDEQLKELQERIDNAIEYINENWGHWCSNHCKYATETINILKGSDKE